MAGSEEQHPAMSTEELVELIKHVNRHPIERDTLYNTVTDYMNYNFSAEQKEAGYISLPVIQ
ncbi:Aminodeoxyfutalosine synthase [compost metagenome]